MSQKHHGGPAPVPPGNRPHAGPTPAAGDAAAAADNTPVEDAGGGFQNQDPKRRLGGYATEGEHPIQQPGRLNDGDVHSR
jgi:hypothetical protein